MHYLDPARPKLPNDTPAWKDAPLIALPSVWVEPAAGGYFDARIILPEDEDASVAGGFIWAERHALTGAAILALLQSWADDPEMTVALWFARSAPQASTTGRKLATGYSGHKIGEGVVEL